MKALSIKQPWASLIAHGIKDIENRTWKTNFRGRIFIHASAKNAGALYELLNEKQIEAISNHWTAAPPFPDRPVSAIIGEVDIVDCVINHPSIWAEKSMIKPNIDNYTLIDNGTESVDYDTYEAECLKYEYSKPIYNWVLANPVLYDKPILNVKGKLSFWDWKGCEQTCESCENVFDMNDMQRDGADNYFCNECATELFPIMQKEYEEMVAKGEIEPKD